MAWKPAEGKQTSRPHFCFNVTSQWHAAGWKEWGRGGGNTYTFTLRAISEADSSPSAKHRQSALVLACSYRCQENQAQFYYLDRKTWCECLCCSEAGLYSFVKITITRCQFCSLTEKKEESYELQTWTYYVHLNVFHLSCISRHWTMKYVGSLKKTRGEGAFPSVWGTPDSYWFVGHEVIKYQVSTIWQDQEEGLFKLQCLIVFFCLVLRF